MHVLIVEDDSSTRRFLKVILEKLGYSTTECETAELGWEAYQREAHAIALLDWMLPGMSGVELCRQIRATPNGEQTVILMSTSQDQLADIEVALKAGADDYIIKPVDIKQMKIRLFIAEQRVRALKDQNQIKTAIKNKLKGLEAERAGLHELIAPVIPIWDGILILPINGPIDNHRMCLIRRKTLQSIRTMQAKQIILDLTAVAFMDADAGKEFMQTLRTIRMVGAHPVLVGINENVAETLVEIIPEQAQISTFTTITDGLQAALNQMRYRISKVDT